MYSTHLISLTIPASVTNLGSGAFSECYDLTNMYFEGNAPSIGSSLFNNVRYLTVYYLPGTLGWGPSFSGVPTSPWLLPYPLILANGLGVQNNQFGFTVSWATNLSCIVEHSTKLINPVWEPLQTNTLSGGVFHFSDSQWTTHPTGFYRIRSPILP